MIQIYFIQEAKHMLPWHSKFVIAVMKGWTYFQKIFGSLVAIGSPPPAHPVPWNDYSLKNKNICKIDPSSSRSPCSKTVVQRRSATATPQPKYSQNFWSSIPPVKRSCLNRFLADHLDINFGKFIHFLSFCCTFYL